MKNRIALWPIRVELIPKRRGSFFKAPRLPLFESLKERWKAFRLYGLRRLFGWHLWQIDGRLFGLTVHLKTLCIIFGPKDARLRDVALFGGSLVLGKVQRIRIRMSPGVSHWLKAESLKLGWSDESELLGRIVKDAMDAQRRRQVIAEVEAPICNCGRPATRKLQDIYPEIVTPDEMVCRECGHDYVYKLYSGPLLAYRKNEISES